MRRVVRKDWEDESDHQTMYEFSYSKKSDLSGLFRLSGGKKRTRDKMSGEETVEYHRTRKNLKKKLATPAKESTKPLNAAEERLKTGKLDTKEEESTETGKSTVESTQMELLQTPCPLDEEDSESGDEMNFRPPPPAQGLSLMDMARRYGEKRVTISVSHKESPSFEIQHRSFSLQSADFLCGFMDAASATAHPSTVAPSVRQFCTNPNVSNALSELGGGMSGGREFPPDQPLRAVLGSYVEGVLALMVLPPGGDMFFCAGDVVRFLFGHLSPGECGAVAMVFGEDPEERLHLSTLVARLTLVALLVVFRSFNARPH